MLPLLGRHDHLSVRAAGSRGAAEPEALCPLPPALLSALQQAAGLLPVWPGGLSLLLHPPFYHTAVDLCTVQPGEVGTSH